MISVVRYSLAFVILLIVACCTYARAHELSCGYVRIHDVHDEVFFDDDSLPNLTSTGVPVAYMTGRKRALDTLSMTLELTGNVLPTKPVDYDEVELQESVEYPDDARGKHLTDKVVMEVLVLKDRRIAKVIVLSYDHEVFVKAAVDAATEALYEPGELSGVKVDAWCEVTVRFKAK